MTDRLLKVNTSDEENNTLKMGAGAPSDYQNPSADEPMHLEEVKRRLQQLQFRTKERIDTDNLKPMSHNKCQLVLIFLFNLIIFPILPLYLSICWIVVQPNQAVIVTSFGKIRKVITQQGCHFNPLLMPEWVSTKVETLQIKGSSVPDLKGSPMNVSVIVNFRIVDPIMATYAVDNYKFYLENQSLEVLRTACSRFNYKSSNDEPCLMSDSTLIGHHMAGLLQERVHVCGIQIQKMEIMEVSYHPEVAQSLLLVQQAQARVDARKLIVQGCVEIVDGAIKQLDDKGYEMGQQDKHDLVKKLMVITCSDQGHAQPVLNV